MNKGIMCVGFECHSIVNGLACDCDGVVPWLQGSIFLKKNIHVYAIKKGCST